MRLTLAIHKTFAAQKSKREEIDFVIRPNSEEKTISVSLLVKQEVAAVCEVAAAYRTFGSSAITSDLTNILRAVSTGNSFSIIAISTNNSRFGPLFPYLSSNTELTTLGQIISTVREELKQPKKAPIRYSIVLSSVCITRHGKIVDLLFPDNNELMVSRDASGEVYYENLAEVACSSDEEFAAILLAIQGEYTQVVETSRKSESGLSSPTHSQDTEETKTPALRLSITIRKYEQIEKSAACSRMVDTLQLETNSSASGLQLSPPGEKIKPRDKPANGYVWNEVLEGTMCFYYTTLQDILGIISKTSRLSTYIFPEMNKPNSSAFFEIDQNADSKLCLMTFDLMNDLFHRCSHAWKAAGVDIFHLKEHQYHRAVSTDLLSSRPRSRSSRSYFTADDLEAYDDGLQNITLRRIEKHTEAEKRCSEFKTRISKEAQGYRDHSITKAPATSLQKGSVPEHNDSEESADAFQLNYAQRPTVLSKKPQRASSRTAKAESQSREPAIGNKRISSATSASISTPTQSNNKQRPKSNGSDTSAGLAKFTHMLHLTTQLAEEDRTQTKKSPGSTRKYIGQIVATEQNRRSESRRTSSPRIVRPREQSSTDARIERAHMIAKQNQSPCVEGAKTVSSMLDKTEPLNLSRGSSVGSRPESRGKARPMSHGYTSPHSSKGAQIVSPTGRVGGTSDRRRSAQSPSHNKLTTETDILSYYKSMNIPADENGQFDTFSKMQLEIKRLARELEETRIAKVVTESGRNNLIAENNRLRDEISTLIENQKYKSHTIKRLEKQLMEARTRQSAKITRLTPQGIPQASTCLVGDRKQQSYDDLLAEIESLRALNNELQADLAVQKSQLLKERDNSSEREDESPKDTVVRDLQILLQNYTTENRNLRLEIVALQEMLDVQRLLARIPSKNPPKTVTQDDLPIKQQLDEAILINKQYEAQISELERAVTAADERLMLYETRQNREALLVETIAQLRSQIHHMTKKLLAYEQHLSEETSPETK